MQLPTTIPTTLTAIRDEIDDDDPGACAQAIDALAILGDTRGLIAGLRSPHAYVRRAAARGLGGTRGVVVTWRLTRLVDDPDEGVRTAVARALTGRSSRLATRTLRRMVTGDPSLLVRFVALAGLERDDGPRLATLLAKLARDDGAGQLREMAEAIMRRRARPRW